MTTEKDIPLMVFAVILQAFILLPLVVHLLRDIRGCTRNCRQGRNCDCRRTKNENAPL